MSEAEASGRLLARSTIGLTLFEASQLQMPFAIASLMCDVICHTITYLEVSGSLTSNGSLMVRSSMYHTQRAPIRHHPESEEIPAPSERSGLPNAFGGASL